MDEIIINARKRSADPAQEHLREQKALWNASTKDLIAKLIAFKRGLNGRGDPQAGLPPSNIKEPFPPQIGQYLSDIATHYTSLVDGAEKIIQEQEHYSNVRRKPQQVMTGVASTSEILDEELYKTASWWGSRWWASNFGIKGAERPLIKSMLRSAVSFHDKLLDVENYLSSSDPNAIPRALYITSSFGIGPYKNIMESFKQMREIHGRDLADPEKPKKPSPEDQKSEQIEEKNISTDQKLDRIQILNYLVEIQKDLPNLQSVANHYLDQESISGPEKAIVKKLKNAVNKGSDISIYIDKLRQGLPLAEDEEADAEKIIMGYRKLLEIISRFMGFDSLSFENYAKKIQSLPIEAVAHNSLSRFIKRKWLEHKPDVIRSDVDLDMRKQITIEHIADTIIAIEEFMNVLEKNLGIDEIFKSLKNFSKKLGVVVEDIITLAEYHSSMFRDENRNKRKGVILHPIIEREINKLRKANIGIKEMSDKILIHRPDFVTIAT